MKARIASAVLLIGLTLCVIQWRAHREQGEEGGPVEESITELPMTNSEGLPLTDDLSDETMVGYGRSETPALQDLLLVFDCIELFDIHLKTRDQLPATGNRELTEALLGLNNDRIRFIRPDGNYLNESGELVDRWQTPYFFHFEDDRYPAIRSAGPDRAMWTADDLHYDFFSREGGRDFLSLCM